MDNGDSVSRRTPTNRLAWILCTAVALWLVGAGVAVWTFTRGDQTAKATATPSVVATSAVPSAVTTAVAPAPSRVADDGSLGAARTVVEAFYAALNSHDVATATSFIAPGQAATVDAATVQEWQPNAFTFVRDTMAEQNAKIFGREKIDTYGSPSPGGVVFTLVRLGGAWYIADMQPADQGQVTGVVPKTAASGGVKGALTDAAARNLIASLLEARQKGDGATIRKLTTGKFQSENGSAWLDGVDNTEAFTKFTIDTVRISGAKATVVVTETWPDGTAPSSYGLVLQNGSVFVDTWQP